MGLSSLDGGAPVGPGLTLSVSPVCSGASSSQLLPGGPLSTQWAVNSCSVDVTHLAQGGSR